eukprot:gene10097-biopygen2221
MCDKRAEHHQFCLNEGTRTGQQCGEACDYDNLCKGYVAYQAATKKHCKLATTNDCSTWQHNGVSWTKGSDGKANTLVDNGDCGSSRQEGNCFVTATSTISPTSCNRRPVGPVPRNPSNSVDYGSTPRHAKL